MTEQKQKEFPPVKVVLLGLDQGEFDPDRSMGELAALCEANHMQAVAELVQKRAAPEAGTVLGEGKLAEARRRGLLLFIATGRHRCDLNNLGDLAFDGYVTLNGQYCYDARGVIYCRSIDPNDIRTAVGLIEREPFPCLFIEEDRMYINCADDNFRAAQRLLNFGDPPVESPSRALRTDIFQLMPFIGPEREPWLMERLPRCRSTRWNPYFMDVVPEGGSKSVGIDAICRSYGIAPDETMAFGDGQNDIEMLRHAGIGVVMGNAAEEVQAAADYVTASVDEDGVSRALRHFGLI